jgi:signal transduction histidine kinase
MNPGRRDAGWAAAAALAVVLGTLAAASAQPDARPLDEGAFALLVAAAGALAWRRRAPLVALAGIVAAAAGYLLARYPYGPILACVGWQMFEVARRRPLRVSGAAAAIAGAVLAAAALPRLSDELRIPALGLAVWAACWLAVPWSLGAVVNVRAAAAARERRDLAARAALEERIRISREVHDVAGHGFAVIAMQAGVALVVLDERPGQARESLTGIRAAAGEALAALRRVLDEPAPADEPADLPALVDRARAAGLPVTLELGPLPPEVGGLVYRVVRESLTNVIRHAGPTEAVVTVVPDGGHLVVTVADRGSGPAGEPGRGLAGLRERVEAVGGTFAAGPRDGGGFTVKARLPVAAA